MNTTLLLLLVALMLCCCSVPTLDAVSVHRCRCIRTVNRPVSAQMVKKIEVIPVSGQCRRTEILITKKTGSTVCVNPEAKWFTELLDTLQKKTATLSSTALPPPTASPTAF